MSSKETKEAIQVLAASLKGQITVVDGKPAIEANAYVGTLPEGLTEDIARKLNEHNSIFFPAVTQAFGEVGIETMKKNKKLDQLTLEVPMVERDHFDLSIKRSHTFPNPAGGEPIQKWGVVSAQLVTQAARANRGDMNSVRDHLAALALEQLAK